MCATWHRRCTTRTLTDKDCFGRSLQLAAPVSWTGKDRKINETMKQCQQAARRPGYLWKNPRVNRVDVIAQRVSRCKGANHCRGANHEYLKASYQQHRVLVRVAAPDGEYYCCCCTYLTRVVVDLVILAGRHDGRTIMLRSYPYAGEGIIRHWAYLQQRPWLRSALSRPRVRVARRAIMSGGMNDLSVCGHWW